MNPDVEQALRTVPGLRREMALELLERFADEGLVRLEWSVPEDVLPPVTVVIPVRNRPRQLQACLAALERLDYPRDRLEVLVVDDASTDETPERCGVVRAAPPARDPYAIPRERLSVATKGLQRHKGRSSPSPIATVCRIRAGCENSLWSLSARAWQRWEVLFYRRMSRAGLIGTKRCNRR